jgi:pimeloyl-ACP methyl ester carboxylesterase
VVVADLTTTDGVRLWYAVDSPPGAPPKDAPRLVLLHGLGSDSSAAEPLVEAIGPRAAVARLDLRGHGRSEAITDPGRYGWFQRAAADVGDLLDTIGWPKAHVFGGSLGAAVALATALATPGRVQSLTLLTPAIGAGPSFASNPLADAFTAAVVEHGFVRVLELLATKRPGTIPPADLLAARLDYERQDPNAMRACVLALRAAVLVADLRALDAVGQPTLVVGRPGDPLHPLALAHDLVARINGARRIDDDPAKPPLWQRPIELASIVLQFVASVERATEH